MCLCLYVCAGSQAGSRSTDQARRPLFGQELLRLLPMLLPMLAANWTTETIAGWAIVLSSRASYPACGTSLRPITQPALRGSLTDCGSERFPRALSPDDRLRGHGQTGRAIPPQMVPVLHRFCEWADLNGPGIMTIRSRETEKAGIYEKKEETTKSIGWKRRRREDIETHRPTTSQRGCDPSLRANMNRAKSDRHRQTCRREDRRTGNRLADRRHLLIIDLHLETQGLANSDCPMRLDVPLLLLRLFVDRQKRTMNKSLRC
ncbi:unnamed protein product [Protopolystoma xenopodis]|uniref:Uncharacterized protein n=1 Tax=Protopolystoma xenopodis TaxID=117903 RepID=A0A3S5C4W8_9PLAT|nr:unnamed protein product [Protopolystoma xenopodis]